MGYYEEYTTYEAKRVAYLKQKLEIAVQNYNQIELYKEELKSATLLDVFRVDEVLNKCDTLHIKLQENKTVRYDLVQTDHEQLVNSLQKLVQGIDELGLPQQKPRQYIRADSSRNIKCRHQNHSAWIQR